MNPLIIDQLKRRWWLWALFCLVHCVLGWTISVTESSTILFFPLAIILGPNIWLIDLQRGYARTVLALPYTARQVGRSLWLVSVGLVAVVMTASSFCGAVLAHGTELPFLKWLNYVITNALFYGSMFWFFIGSPNLPSPGWQKKLQQLLFRIFGIGVIFGCIFLLMFDRDQTGAKMILFYVITLTMTIVGWLRAEAVIMDYGAFRLASQQPQKSRRQFAPPGGRGGIPFIFQNSFAHAWGFGLLMLVVLDVIHWFSKREFDWHHLTVGITNGSAIFPIFFVLMARSVPLFYNLRALRMLPISTRQLVAVFLGNAILPLLTFCLAVTALAWHETGSAECVSYFKIELLVAASVSIFIAVTVWNTQATFIKSVILAILIVSSFIPAIYEMTYGPASSGKNGLPFSYVAVFTIGLLACSYWAMCRIISGSSSAYRRRQYTLGNQWNWGR